MPRVKDPLELDDLYENLYTGRNRKAGRRATDSIGINYNGAKVDLVPGRLQSAPRRITRDCFLGH